MRMKSAKKRDGTSRIEVCVVWPVLRPGCQAPAETRGAFDPKRGACLESGGGSDERGGKRSDLGAMQCSNVPEFGFGRHAGLKRPRPKRMPAPHTEQHVRRSRVGERGTLHFSAHSMVWCIGMVCLK